MQAATTVGLDIAKSVFQIHGVDATGNVVVRRTLKRRYVLPLSTSRHSTPWELPNEWNEAIAYPLRIFLVTPQLCIQEFLLIEKPPQEHRQKRHDEARPPPRSERQRYTDKQPTAGLGAVGGYAALKNYTSLGGQLTVFALGTAPNPARAGTPKGSTRR